MIVIFLFDVIFMQTIVYNITACEYFKICMHKTINQFFIQSYFLYGKLRRDTTMLVCKIETFFHSMLFIYSTEQLFPALASV